MPVNPLIETIVGHLKMMSRADQIAVHLAVLDHLRTDGSPGCDCTYLAPELRKAGALCSKCRKTIHNLTTSVPSQA